MKASKKLEARAAFEKKNSVSDNTTDTVGTLLEGKKNDKATLQNTVSEDKITKDSEKIKASKIIDEKRRTRWWGKGLNEKKGQEQPEQLVIIHYLPKVVHALPYKRIVRGRYYKPQSAHDKVGIINPHNLSLIISYDN